jgi:hypothetical protein
VDAAMEDIGARMDEREGAAFRFAEEADLVYNPFPARVTVILPGSVMAMEGFKETKPREVTIEPVDLYRAVASLEGRWVQPDPLAAILRDEKVTSVALAELPRRTAPVVTASEVSSAILEKLQRPGTYVVRWRT